MIDLDFNMNTERISIWKCAKFAFITMMRSWVGIILISTDMLGLKVLISVLKDPKVTIHLHIFIS